MDQRRLEQFVAVAEEGSVGRAARGLGLAQPTLTRNIHTLEAELGVTLFERNKTGMKLTRAGEIFLPRAKSLLHDMERAVADITTPDTSDLVIIRFGSAPNFAERALVKAIPQLLAEAPQARLELSFNTREALVEKVRNQELDMALCIMPNFIHTPARELQDLDFLPIEGMSIEPFAPLGHDLLHGDDISLSSVSHYGWAIPHQMSLSYRFESAFFRNQLLVPRQTVTAPQTALLREIALNSGLLAMLPVDAQGDERFVKLPIPELTFQYDVGVITRRMSRLSPVCKRFSEIIGDCLGG